MFRHLMELRLFTSSFRIFTSSNLTVIPLALCRGKLSAVISRLVSKCLWGGGGVEVVERALDKYLPLPLLSCELQMVVQGGQGGREYIPLVLIIFWGVNELFPLRRVTRGEERGGRSPLPFFENWKKVPSFGEKMP